MPAYQLPLNRSVLVFFPPDEYDMHLTGRTLYEARVVQVYLKQRKSTLRDMETFFRVQQDITTAIESILLAHITSPLPASLTVEGEGYTLYGSRKPWNYAKPLRFTWGSRDVRAAEEKWVFVFAPSPVE
ncbi:hypothetical protein FPV67DRAFT_1450450 [Lyophyllum atratum]|nr:hypothetical protein FPV67DRAFT_1450450 [Lyophyllum atratum]